MSRKWKIILAFAAVYLIWGSTYLAIVFAIRDIPPFLMSGMRFFLAGILLYGWCVFVRKEKQPDLSSLGKNALCGILMLFGGTGSLAWAEQYISSGLAAIIITSIPFWFVLLDKKQWSFYFSNKIILFGLLVGFAGVALLIFFGKSSPVVSAPHSKQLAGMLILIVGGISWTVGSLYSKYKPANSSITMNTSIQLMMAGLFSTLVGIVTGEAKDFSFSQIHTSSLLALLYLAMLGSLLTYLCYIWLLQVRPAAQVSSYVYVNPIVAIVLGAIIGREIITGWHIISLIIILVGVLLVNLPKYKTIRSKQLSVS
ncbi:MAG TPA: EamA family transporter [Chitinophagaceae bacterium]|nr:EamA family transporter [Chitinophagaceae bacterium]